MHWRLSAAAYEGGKGEPNRERLRARVESDRPAPGLIAYTAGEPVAWCAVGPRSEFVRMRRSRVLAPVDDRPVWSVVCFFVSREHRRRGITVHLLERAAAFARSHGAEVLEGYPVDRSDPDIPPVFAFTGLARAFETVGFTEVERRSPTRPILRLEL